MEILNRFSKRPRAALEIDPKENLTKESFKDECDINKIIAKAQRTGVVPSTTREPRYEDISNIPSYQEALNVVLTAQNAFFSLPASVRAECGNDPEVFLSRVQEPAWAQKHGLLRPEASPGSQEPAKGAPGAPAPGQPGPAGSSPAPEGAKPSIKASQA